MSAVITASTNAQSDWPRSGPKSLMATFVT